MRRDVAVEKICGLLGELVVGDSDLIDQIVSAAELLDGQMSSPDAERIASLERQIASQGERIADLTELAGQGSPQDRAEMKARVKAAQAERASKQRELAALRQAESAPGRKITRCDVEEILSDFARLLDDAASGRLGESEIFKAADLFRRLVGGRVVVHGVERVGRKRRSFRGEFTPDLLRVTTDAAMLTGVTLDGEVPHVTVWLREPPARDRFAETVRALYEDEGLGFRQIGKRLDITHAMAYQAYQRFYEMIGQPLPPRRPQGRTACEAA